MSVRDFKKPDNKKFESVKDYLDANSFTFRETDTHYQLNCPICNETRERLGISKDGQEDVGKWRCFNCGAHGSKTGTLDYAINNKGVVDQKRIKSEKSTKKKKSTIEPELHKKFHDAAVKKKQSLQTWVYLKKHRGITEEAIEYFKLGSRSVFKDKFDEEKDCGEHLAIPYLVDGKCVNLKYRALDPNVDKKFKWRREKGGETVLFNHDVLYDIDEDTLLIAESELDCISLWCLGFKNVVGMTAGADGFQDLWVDQLERFKRFYLVLDRDEAGQDGAHKVAKRLGLDKCFNVMLPDDVKDPNDFLLKYKTEDFKNLMKGARQFEVPNVVSLGSAIDELIKDIRNGRSDDTTGFDTPWKKVNEKMGPIKPGHLIILAARPKVGKSTLAYNWMKHLGHNKVPVGMYTCEMKEKDIGYRMSQSEVYTLPQDQDNAEVNDLLEARIRLPMNKIHFYYPQIGDLELEKVEDKIREMVQRYGIKVFFFDNMHFLCRGEDEKSMIDKASQMFKILAVNLGIAIVLVSHPRKGSDGKNIGNDDLKGSSSMFQDADSIILMNRRLEIEDDINDEQAELALSKTMLQITARFRDGGRVNLAFNGRHGLLTDRGLQYNRVMQFIKDSNFAKRKEKRKA